MHMMKQIHLKKMVLLKKMMHMMNQLLKKIKTMVNHLQLLLNKKMKKMKKMLLKNLMKLIHLYLNKMMKMMMMKKKLLKNSLILLISAKVTTKLTPLMVQMKKILVKVNFMRFVQNSKNIKKPFVFLKTNFTKSTFLMQNCCLLTNCLKSIRLITIKN